MSKLVYLRDVSCHLNKLNTVSVSVYLGTTINNHQIIPQKKQKTH